MIYEILDKISNAQGTNTKIALLKANSGNELLKRVFVMTLDKVKFSYGIRKFPNVPPAVNPSITLSDVLDFLELELATRNATGNNATQRLAMQLTQLSQEDFLVIRRVIDRDLKCGLGRTQTLKVWPGSIVKPPYQRCNLLSDKTRRHIKYPAYIQLKMDGLGLFTIITCDGVTSHTRSGEEIILRSLQYLQDIPELVDTVIQGEVTIPTLNRSESNGVFNSIKSVYSVNTDLSFIHLDEDKIVYTLWDIIPLSDYTNCNCTIPYADRLNTLKSLFVDTNQRTSGTVQDSLV